MKKYIRSSINSGYIGIWWYDAESKRVGGKMCDIDDADLANDKLWYDLSQNHMTLWKSTCEDWFNSDTYNLGYKGIERGRVYYDIITHSYVATCSKAIINDNEFRSKIRQFFELDGCAVDFVGLDQYCKLPLTSNPSVDSFNYGI